MEDIVDTPLELAYRGVEPTEATDDLIRRGVEELETLVDRITSCRATVELPNLRRQKGDLYRVRLDLRLPGAEVVVDRTPPEHRSNEELNAAIGEAFDTARRRLIRLAERRRGDVKAHDTMPEGVVVRLFPDAGYGFIETRDGDEVYFHENSVKGGRFEDLTIGWPVRLVVEEGDKGPQAAAVILKEGPAPSSEGDLDPYAESTMGHHTIRIEAGDVTLFGELEIPQGAQGLVVFAHGSGSSRHSPRNHQVARVLRGAQLGTLLFDLLTEDEDLVDQETREHRFDIDLLGARLTAVTDWLRSHAETHQLLLGYFGASTGAAAALVAAAERPEDVAAVVSRGGRPDLAGSHIPRVRAPTLLIVGGVDHPVIEMNRDVLDIFETEAKLEIVPGASHLFVEPGALDEAARLAADWFKRYLAPPAGEGGD